MQSRLEGVATAMVIMAAVTVSIASIRREFYPANSSSAPAINQPPKLVSNWKDLEGAGTRIGDSTARVTIVEFADLECPFCKLFHTNYALARQKYGKDVSLVFVHFPLPMHRFARPAARADECAGAQGRFGEFQDAIYSKQDSLGLKSWTSYAVEAGVQDTAKFLRCASDTAKVPRIEQGLALGNKIDVTGTPTVIVNGWRYSMTPYDSISDIIGHLLAGQPPGGAKPTSGPTRRGS